MKQAAWRHFAHEADIGIRGSGTTLAEAFEQAAVALTAVMSDPACIRPLQKVTIRCQAPEPALLLVDWLNALVYETAVQHLLFSRFDVHIDGERLRATAWGEKIDRQRHEPAVEVKGATLTELKVEQEADGHWIAQCVVDV